MRTVYNSVHILVAFLSIAALGAAPAASAQTHTVTLYATDGPRGGIVGSHTFAVIDNAYTISWMPAALGAHPLHLVREPGRNYSYAETLLWARAMGSTVRCLGTVPISEACYLRARALLKDMEAGRILYKLTGPTNCIQAVSLVSGKRIPTGLACGSRASLILLYNFARLQ